ncbi:thiol peroxidase [uncultured Corynebacterium sp.]|uniref:thiol peroxidase n=1 Tax=uncultured Corynebacterium sp. TaxID=159447 RepID=UPI00280A6180|nr:thiol peroxidase [uncultured Corynebacterium sp.]
MTNETFAGTRLIISILPSIETPACQEQLRRFHEQVSQLDNTKLLSVSLDLTFTLKRFCAADGIDDVIAASALRSDFGEKFGVTVRDSVLEGLLARCVVVADENHKVIHTQMVPSVVTQLDYDKDWDILR